MKKLKIFTITTAISMSIILGMLCLFACNNPYTPDISVSGFESGDKTTTSTTSSTTSTTSTSSTNNTTTTGPSPILQCPGETQCSCAMQMADESGGQLDPCPGDLFCGPTHTCTKECLDDSDCTSGISGEACIGSLCAVLCDPAVPSGGCQQAGMPDAQCITILGVNACGYP